MDPDPDPGGPKTYGSYGYGSATLVERGSSRFSLGPRNVELYGVGTVHKKRTHSKVKNGRIFIKSRVPFFPVTY
jgi:hypothetical protein